MSDAIISSLHYLGIMALFAALVVEHLLFRPSLDAASVLRLARVDLIYGLAAGVVLVTGLGKVFWTGKPPSFYGQNGLFHLKFFLFVAIGLCSLWPTRHFLRARRAVRSDPERNRQVELPGAIRHVIRIELAGLVLLPVLAAFMARGYGYFGG